MDTLNLLMKRAEQRNSDKMQIKKFHSKVLGGDILLRKPPLSTLTRLMDEASKTETTMEAIEANAEMVYEGVPDIKNNYNKLKEAFEAENPIDLVIRIFDSNLSELNDIAEAVSSFFTNDSIDQVKN